LTQEQLADKIGAKKSFISRIENGHSDIQLSTLYRLRVWTWKKNKLDYSIKKLSLTADWQR